MLLSRVNIIGDRGPKDIRIRNEKIEEIAPEGSIIKQPGELFLSFDAAIAFPGLINSHDHLDFNLFPRLGNRIYNSYREWGKDIHAVNKTEIARVLQIPLALRVQWGIYKNLLNGITTVVNHGKPLAIQDKLITVHQKARSLHSPAFEKNWKFKINSPFIKNLPFVIHLGEGTDEKSGREVDSLIKWNIFKRRVIAIHGVAMSPKHASAFRALIWCPASNYFLLNKTAPVSALGEKLSIMLGTDSTLTASWNIWEQLRLARNEKMIPDEDLLKMLTRVPAKIWGLDLCGAIDTGKQADLVIASGKSGMKAFDRFYSLNPEDLLLVIHQGNMRMFDMDLMNQIKRSDFSVNGFSKISVNGRIKYVEGDLPGLMNRIKKYYPAVVFPVSLP